MDIFVFGALILYAAFNLARHANHKVQPEHNPVVRIFRRVVPVSDGFNGDRFFVRCNARLMATPLLIVVLVVESTDLMFALDSVPAIFTVSRDPLILYTSNAFAILGLRALYFVLAGVATRFIYLRQGAVAILAFVGIKMPFSGVFEIPTALSFVVIAVVLAASVGLSLIRRTALDVRSASL